MGHTDKYPKTFRAMLKWRRDWRFRTIIDLVRTAPGMSVLDIGCGTDGRSFSDQADPTWRITGVDLHEPGLISHSHPNFRYRKLSAVDLGEFTDMSFDLVISVGMLEHITDEAAFHSVCREIQRLSRQYVVVVPFKWAWVEPHYAFPFFGALPHSVQVWLIRSLDLSGHKDRIDYFENNFRWRSNAEYLKVFPGSRIHLLPLGDTIAIVGTDATRAAS
jgi:SAM-dependent methyltransferase